MLTILKNKFLLRCARSHHILFLTLALSSFSAWADALPTHPLLLRHPTLNAHQIAFSFAGYIWIADRDGNNPHPVTHGGHEERPFFSPDGSLIAYTGIDEGIRSIFLIPATGGTPRRLTYHPADMDAAGWSPDGREVLFTSARMGYAPRVDENTRLFTVPTTGGMAMSVPLKRSSEGSYSPDGAMIAYVPNVQWAALYNGDWRDSIMDTWKHYRGGQTKRIWIARLSDSSVLDTIPRENSNDFNPMWVGNRIYFLSDRDGPASLFFYDLTSKQVTRIVTAVDEWDIKSACASTDAIIYEQMGSLHVLDLKSGKTRRLDIHPSFTSPATQAHLVSIQPGQISEATLSPNGKHAAFTARGEILTVSAETGASTDLTNSTDAVERTPAWSPDAASIAYLSDASGGYALHVRNADGSGEVHKISLGVPSSFYYALAWAPDSTKIGYWDKRLNYWYINLRDKNPVLVDTDNYAPQREPLQFSWSSDSQWIAYTKQLPSHVHAAFLYSLADKKAVQVTDGTSDVLHVAFDRSGKYLYFTASTDLFGASEDWSNIRRPLERHVYAVTLRNDDLPSLEATDTLIPQTRGRRPSSTPAPETRIDLPGIGQRISLLPIPAANYVDVYAAAPGTILLVETSPNTSSSQIVEADDTGRKLIRFDVNSQKSDTIVNSAMHFDFSYTGSSVLYSHHDRWFVISTVSAPAKAESRDIAEEVNLSSLEVRVDPRTEWHHIFDQILRDERLFFYDPGLHGLTLSALRQRYEPFLQELSNREELNYLLEDMLGEMVSGHMFMQRGSYPESVAVKTGLLGADYIIKDDRYQISKVYEGDIWDPMNRGPLASPASRVRPGEFVLAVNGRGVAPPADIYSFFQGLSGKEITLKVGPRPDGLSSREIRVVPIDDETSLRNYSWIEANRRKVQELSGGRIAYVYLPDVSAAGYRDFNRYYFAQSDKRAAIIDDRFNHGGSNAEYISDFLRRSVLGYWYQREQRDLTIPLEGIFGPKVMLINEMSGSGGDMLPWFFHRLGVGTLIGTRTWGGIVSTAIDPGDLMDGSIVSTPDQAFYNPDGAWDIENLGVAPDIEVNDSSKIDEDPQLEKAVAVALALLKTTPSRSPPGHPAFPNYHQNDSLGSLPPSSSSSNTGRLN